MNNSVNKPQYPALRSLLVNASVKTLNNDNGFKHIIKHALSCTLEKEDINVSVMLT